MKEWTGVVTVLSVSPSQEDHRALEHLFTLGEWAPCKWALHASFTLESAVTALQEDRVPIILSECDLNPATWRDILQHVSLFSEPPLVIVTSRLADERLWAEALNLGAYDVLAKPFNRDEVYRILESAWRHWASRHELSRSATNRAAQLVFDRSEIMEVIILPDDELQRLEREFGRAVRQMGTWSSDGVFGYSSVPVSIVERVARGSNDPSIVEAVSRLKNSAERTKSFVELLQTFGPALIGKIVTACRECPLDSLRASSEREQGPIVDWMPMTPSALLNQNDWHFVEGSEWSSHSLSDAPTREDDLALCFVCLRWASEGPSCRQRYRCDEPPFHGPKFSTFEIVMSGENFRPPQALTLKAAVGHVKD